MFKRLTGREKTAILTLAIVSYLSLPAFAAADAESEAIKTRDVVVSATRTEREIKETPASVEVITREDIETMGADNVMTALKLATSLNLSKAGMTGNAVSLRGMNTSQTLILIDGRRMAGEDTAQTANYYELSRVNIENVERIEIVRGPVSSLYGSDALGGVVNIIMRKPLTPRTTVGLSSGTEEQNASFRFDLGKEGKWSWAADARFTDVRDRTYASGNTAMYGPRQYLNVNGTYDITDNQKLDVFYERMSEHLNERYADSLMSKGQKERFDNARDSYGATYRGKSENSDYEMRAYYNRLNKDAETRKQGVFTDFDRAKYETWVVDGKNSMQLGDRHLFTFGGEYRSSSYRGTRLGDGGENSYTEINNGIAKAGSEATIDSQAFFVQDEWLASDKLLVIPSLRYDSSDKFGDNISPKIGLTYKLNDNFRLKANFGKGFKAPTISELYMNMRRAMGPMIVEVLGNPDLKPEKSRSYDLSLEGEKGKNFGKLTYFNNKVTDLINTETIAGSNPMINSSQYVNVDQAQINGVEFELGRKLSDRFTIKTTYNYLDAKNSVSGERLSSRAKHQSTLQLQYSLPGDEGVGAVLWNEWVRDYRYDGKDYDYSMLNFTVHKKWNETYSTYLGVDNVLDKKVDDLTIDGLMWRFGVNLSL